MPPLPLFVFVTGASSLGAEIAAVRLLAPYFGASTIVWANTIGVVLVALSVGYWLGGRLADRHPNRRALGLVTLLASALLALVPFVARPLLDVAVSALDQISAGAFVGSLVGVLGLVALPVLLLGTVSPWALRLALERVEDAGQVAGRLYALSTAGSLFGTLISALLLIPLVGTRRTFLLFALSLALVAVPALWPRRRFALVPVGILLLLALPVGTLKAQTPNGRVIAERETEYQYARVIQRSDGSRVLELNEGQAIHSLWRAGTVLTGDYWDGFLVDPLAALGRPPRTMAILGNAAGTTARAYGRYWPQTSIDAVEIDPALTELGRRWFGLRNPRMRVHHADARPWLRQHGGRYDVIQLDAYRQPYIPFYLTTKEFFEEVAGHLTPGGVVAINLGHPQGQQRLEEAMSATLGAVFRTVRRDPIEPTNTILLASAGPISADRMERALAGRDPALQALGRDAAARFALPLEGGPVWTDDHAPVEWLVDGSIVSYAAGDDSG